MFMYFQKSKVYGFKLQIILKVFLEKQDNDNIFVKNQQLYKNKQMKFEYI